MGVCATTTTTTWIKISCLILFVQCALIRNSIAFGIEFDCCLLHSCFVVVVVVSSPNLGGLTITKQRKNNEKDTKKHWAMCQASKTQEKALNFYYDCLFSYLCTWTMGVCVCVCLCVFHPYHKKDHPLTSLSLLVLLILKLTCLCDEKAQENKKQYKWHH